MPQVWLGHPQSTAVLARHSGGLSCRSAASADHRVQRVAHGLVESALPNVIRSAGLRVAQADGQADGLVVIGHSIAVPPTSPSPWAACP
jgi:hypothetical protein